MWPLTLRVPAARITRTDQTIEPGGEGWFPVPFPLPSQTTMQPTGFGDALAADRLQLGSIPLTGAELFEDGRRHVARRCR